MDRGEKKRREERGYGSDRGAGCKLDFNSSGPIVAYVHR